MHGASSQSMVVVTAYETLGADGLRHSMIETSAKAIFVEPNLFKTLSTVLPDASDIGYVIYNDNKPVDTEMMGKLKKTRPEVRFLSFEELRRFGVNHAVEPLPPQPDDLCCIMYTSGTTGTPKGVPLTHRNIVVAGIFPPCRVNPRLQEGD